MRKAILGIAACCALAGAANAQDLKLVFPASNLDEAERQLLVQLLTAYQSNPQIPDDQRISAYGAMAVSPSFFELWASDPNGAILSGLLQMVGNFETEAEADTAALEACEAARQTGQRRCIVGARLLPE